MVKALETPVSRSAPVERVGQESDGVGKTLRSAEPGDAPVEEADAHISEVGVEAEAVRLQAARLELDVMKRKETDRRLSNAGSFWEWHKEVRLVVGIEEVRNIYTAVVGRFGTGGGDGLEDHGSQAVGGEGQGKKAGEYRYLPKSVYEAAAQELFQEGVITSPKEVCLRIMTVVGRGDKCAYQHGHVNKANLTKLAQALPRSFKRICDTWGGLATWQVICRRQQTIMGSGAAGSKQQGSGRKCGANDERLDVSNAYSDYADDVSSDESDGVSGCESMEDHSPKRGVG